MSKCRKGKGFVRGIWPVPGFHERVALILGSSQVLGSLQVPSPLVRVYWEQKDIADRQTAWLGQHQLTVEAINTLIPSGVEVFHDRNLIHSVAKIITCVFHLSVFFPHTCCHQPCFYVLGGDFTFTPAQGPQLHLDFHMQG